MAARPGRAESERLRWREFGSASLDRLGESALLVTDTTTIRAYGFEPIAYSATISDWRYSIWTNPSL